MEEEEAWGISRGWREEEGNLVYGSAPRLTPAANKVGQQFVVLRRLQVHTNFWSATAR